MFQMKEEKKKN